MKKNVMSKIAIGLAVLALLVSGVVYRGAGEGVSIISQGTRWWGSGGFALPAAGNVTVDGDTTNQTQTSGAVDVDIGTTTADVNALNVAFTQDDGTSSGTDGYGGIFTLTQNDADADMRGIKMSAAATDNAAADSYEYGYYFDCAEDTSGACEDAFLAESSGTSNGVTDAFDASASNIENALNVGSNDILLGDETLDVAVDDSFRFTRNDSGSVTLTCADDDVNATCIYDSGGTGSVQLGTADTTSVDALAGLDVQGGDITMENDETLSNSTDGYVQIGGFTTLTEGSVQVATYGGTITCQASFQPITSTAAITNAVIADASVAGTVVVLSNENGSDDITITESGSNLQCGGDITLTGGDKDTATLLWDGAEWICLNMREN